MKLCHLFKRGVKLQVNPLLCLLVVGSQLLTSSVTSGHSSSYEENIQKESWTAWIKRYIGPWVPFGSSSHSEDHEQYYDDTPDPNEGWSQWAKRQACRAADTECCAPPEVRIQTFISNLKGVLEKEFFAQHLAAEIIINSIASHWKGNPRRPLVLSFHGWTGSGKTYLSQLIAKALFKRGENSRFYRHFTQGYDFYEKEEYHLPAVRARLQNELLTVGRRCEYTLFVIDEVDGISPSVLDALVPFVDYPAVVGGVSFRKSIFIFLNNVGSNEINETALKAWKAGKSRESLTIHDFENIISLQSFKEKGHGLYRSKLIDKNLIDYSIPFLPMEKKHVKMCVEHEALRQGVEGLDPEEIVKNLAYWPPETPLFSTSGCKKVERAVLVFKERNNQRTEL